ncbi:MAG: peptide deformylase [Bacteroidales bacterium]|nr:peptide deformylase [Tenuifilaceae bacterium]
MGEKVLIYGSPVLRKDSEHLTEKDNIAELASSLFATLKNEGGIGLAAPQIGVLKSMFIINSEPMVADDPSVELVKRIVINPEIISFSNETSYFNEGCLSIPDIFEQVERPTDIVVKYFNEQMKPVKRTIKGLEARIFQHEFDHLGGVLFIDRVSTIRRTILAAKLKRLQRLSKKL